MGTHPIFESDFDCLTDSMTTLADELAADFEDDEEDVIEEHDVEMKEEINRTAQVKKEPEIEMQYQSIDDVDSVTQLLESSDFKDSMVKIRASLGENPKPWFGLVEQNPEYQLVVKANELCTKIDNEISIVHKFVQDMYAERFPELNGMIPEPSVYLKTVNILGNDIEVGMKKLDEVLTAQTILIVSVTASTTSGKKMNEERLAPLRRGCEIGSQLCEARDLILQFVESRMEFIAPNICRIVGPGIAAKVTALAARVDCFHESDDGTVGKDLLEKIYEKYDKWQEPPPSKATKALPVPLEAPRKKRGGRRARKMKERMGMTEMRRLKNRMNFGEIEDDVNQCSIGDNLGLLNAKGANSGKVRAAAVDKKTQARISKALQQKLARSNAAMNASNVLGGTHSVWAGGRTTVGRDNVSGMASSVAFTPLKGLEIINPNAAEKREESNKYFSDDSGFTSVKPL